MVLKMNSGILFRGRDHLGLGELCVVELKLWKKQWNGKWETVSALMKDKNALYFENKSEEPRYIVERGFALTIERFKLRSDILAQVHECAMELFVWM